MKATLRKIRSHRPCADGWAKLLKHLGKTQADDEPLAITTILASNGLDDALWCLRAVDGHDKQIRLYAVWCARQVQHLITDQRSLNALDIAGRYAHGQSSAEELAAAWNAAWEAARDVTRDAAWRAAWSASRDSIRDATRDVAWDAAWAVAWDAARDATQDAKQDVVWDAAWAVAWRAARATQTAELRRICS